MPISIYLIWIPLHIDFGIVLNRLHEPYAINAADRLFVKYVSKLLSLKTIIDFTDRLMVGESREKKKMGFWIYMGFLLD